MRRLILSLYLALVTSMMVSGETYQFDTIESCTVVSKTPYEVVYDVRYYYAGSRGPAFLGVHGYEGAQQCDYLSCQPVRLKVGRGVARVSLAINERMNRRQE